MECPVDPNMSITAVTHAKWYGAPGPLFCGPKTDEQPFSGFWDHLHECKSPFLFPCAFFRGKCLGILGCASPTLRLRIASSFGRAGNRPWANPPETCDVYEGQKAGRYDQSAPYANVGERTKSKSCSYFDVIDSQCPTH